MRFKIFTPHYIFFYDTIDDGIHLYHYYRALGKYEDCYYGKANMLIKHIHLLKGKPIKLLNTERAIYYDEEMNIK